MAEDKGFKPSEKRIKNARIKGQVLKSPLISQTAAILGAVTALVCYLHLKKINLLGLTRWTISEGFSDIQLALLAWMQELIWLLLVPAVAGAVCAILAECFQVGLKIHLEVLAPDFTRMDVAKGFKKIGQGLLNSWSLFLKAIFIFALGFYFLEDQPSVIAIHVASSTEQIFTSSQHSIVATFCTALLALMAFAAVEYFFKRKKYFAELSMSLDDVRREQKEDEGDPHVKNHRKHLHQSLMSQELIKRVRRSKVLIVEKRRPEPIKQA